jgi:hypothetical protein
MHRLGGLLAKLRKESVAPSDSPSDAPILLDSEEGSSVKDIKNHENSKTSIQTSNQGDKSNLKQIRHQQRRSRQRLKKRLGSGERSPISSDEAQDSSSELNTTLQETSEIHPNLTADLRPSLWFKVTKDNKIPNDFIKSAKWSPTGDRIITCSEEKGALRCYQCPGQSALEQDLEWYDPSANVICAPECVYDYCWYPYSNLEIENSSLVAVSSRSRPIQLWDVCNSTLRASYRSYDHVGMVSTPHSVAFSLDGSKLIGGFDSCLRIFPVDCPGTVYTEYWTKEDKRKRTQTKYEEDTFSPYSEAFTENLVGDSDYNMSGIISSLAVSPSMPGVMSCGTFSGEVSIFDESVMKPVAQLGELVNGKYKLIGTEKARHAGVTQLKLTSQNQLLVGFRNFGQIQCYDLRMLRSPVWAVHRQSENAQRIGFDVDYCGRILISGSRDGVLKSWEISSSSEPLPLACSNMPSYPRDSISYAQFHPYMPYFCFTTGQRRLAQFEEDSSDSDTDSDSQRNHATSSSSVPQNQLLVGYWS